MMLPTGKIAQTSPFTRTKKETPSETFGEGSGVSSRYVGEILDIGVYTTQFYSEYIKPLSL